MGKKTRPHCIVQGTISSLLEWTIMKNNILKGRSICVKLPHSAIQQRWNNAVNQFSKKADERIMAVSYFTWLSVNTSTGQLVPHSHSPVGKGMSSSPKLAERTGWKPAEIPFQTSSLLFPKSHQGNSSLTSLIPCQPNRKLQAHAALSH